MKGFIRNPGTGGEIDGSIEPRTRREKRSPGCYRREVSGAETCRDGNSGCVAARRHENPTEARIIVACVQVDPSAFKKDLIPGAEISGTAIRLADVPDVAGDITPNYVFARQARNVRTSRRSVAGLPQIALLA